MPPKKSIISQKPTTTRFTQTQLQAGKPIKRLIPSPKLSPLDTLSSWSYSVYTQYMNCPLSVCFEKIKKIRVPEPPNPAFEKGNRVHKAAEDFIAGRVKKVSSELTTANDKLTFFKKLKASTELEWAFNRDWVPTGWFAPDAWLRVKTDACAVEPVGPPTLIHITDWKTGKVYDDHKQQRSLYALAGLELAKLGNIKGATETSEVSAEHIYTDTGQAATEHYTPKDLKPLRREWLSRIKQMMSDTRYPAKVGYKCRYCKFRKSNGGPCEENQ